MEKISDLRTVVYGIQPVYKDGNTIRIPVNGGAEWAQEALTKEDWEKIEAANQELEAGNEVKLELSCGTAVLEIAEHPEGSDRGGYVPKLSFQNVEQYSLQDHQVSYGGVSLYYNDLGEWQ
jgi:hypothetical protein